MGEVYRADDLRLGQQVALKLLPEGLRQDPARLAQFHNEVRMARQVSHPNVCRVYDIGESEGFLYLSMEYVDGEDLASSLRRIGRFPEDKAIAIARQLCAGVAAAHQRGIVHRDLKPANVMLDGTGAVRVMDFGLAAAGQVENIRAGTPGYMAPEQLLGREVTTRSDIFALGLVIYELFTGRRAFNATSIGELVSQHETGTITRPSTLIGGLNQAIERAILRCLESDPAKRPATALAVSAALPGGDPLAALLAAGETPSPELVAAAGEGAGLSLRVAWTLYGSIIAGMIVCFAMSIHTSPLDVMRPTYTPDVLAQKARDAIRQIGYPQRPADEAYGFEWNDALMKHVTSTDKPAPQWRTVLSQRPSPLGFWYRQSSDSLTATAFHTDLLTPGIVGPDDPPPLMSGMTQLELDHEGRLESFETIPPQRVEKPIPKAPVDWGPLFTLAGLDERQLQPAEPLWNWLATSDTRAAWTGTWPGSGRPLRVEAAALGGRPVAFTLIGPWRTPWRMPEETKPGEKATVMSLFALAFGILAGAGLLARKNILEGRGDQRGAGRLALATFSVLMALWSCQVHLVASLGLLAEFLIAVCTASFYGVLLWTIYVALEPFVRRQWPQRPRLLDKCVDGTCPRSGRRTRRADRLGARRGVGADDSSGRPLLEAQRPCGLSRIDGSALRPSRDHGSDPSGSTLRDQKRASLFLPAVRASSGPARSMAGRARVRGNLHGPERAWRRSPVAGCPHRLSLLRQRRVHRSAVGARVVRDRYVRERIDV